MKITNRNKDKYDTAKVFTLGCITMITDRKVCHTRIIVDNPCIDHAWQLDIMNNDIPKLIQVLEAWSDD